MWQNYWEFELQLSSSCEPREQFLELTKVHSARTILLIELKARQSFTFTCRRQACRCNEINYATNRLFVVLLWSPQADALRPLARSSSCVALIAPCEFSRHNWCAWTRQPLNLTLLPKACIEIHSRVIYSYSCFFMQRRYNYDFCSPRKPDGSNSKRQFSDITVGCTQSSASSRNVRNKATLVHMQRRATWSPWRRWRSFLGHMSLWMDYSRFLSWICIIKAQRLLSSRCGMIGSRRRKLSKAAR